MNAEKIIESYDFAEWQEGFVIDTPDKANWAIGKIKTENAECDMFVKAANAAIARYQQQIGERTAKAKDRNAPLLSALREYMKCIPARTTKTQMSHELPDGKIVVKFASKSMEPDREKLCATLAGTAYVENKPTLKWAELKQQLKISGDSVINKETGEIVEGVKIVEQPEEIEVK